MSNSKQLKIGSLLSYAQMIISVVIGIIYTPFILNALGDSEYGLYSTVSSTIAVLSILSLGFNASYIRYYTKYKKEEDYESIYKLNGLFIIIFTIIGVVALACGLFLSFNLSYVFAEGLTNIEYETATVLMILLSFNLAWTFPASVFTSIISAHEKFIFLKILGIGKTVLGPLIHIPILLLGYGSIGMVVSTVIITLAIDLIYFFFVVKKLNQKFIFKNFEKGICKSLFIFTSFIAINLIVDQINNSMGKVLLGRYKGTSAVTVFSVGHLLYTYYVTFSTSISGVFTPRVHKIINDTANDKVEQTRQLTEIFTKVGRIQFLILGLISTGVIFFGLPFIRYWAPNISSHVEAYCVALLLIVPGTVPLVQNTGIEIQRAQNRHKFRSIVYLCMAIANLVASIFLCQVWGVIGASLGTVAHIVIACGVIMNIYYHKKCNINILHFWKNILRMLLGLIAPVILGVIMIVFIEITSIWQLLILVLCYVLVYCVSVWLLSMNTYEKDLIRKVFKKFSRK